MKNSEYTLGECLNKLGLRKLPPAMTQGNYAIWINAIVRVQKLCGIEYCLANNDGNGNPIIVHDFGAGMAINKILSIHPVECVSGKFTPDLRSDRQIIQFLVKNGYDETKITKMLNKAEHETAEDAKKDRDKVKQFINEVVIKIARKELAERERVAAIKEYAQNEKRQRSKK